MKYLRNCILLAFLVWNIANLDASSSSSSSADKTPLFTSNHVLKIEGNYLNVNPLDVTLVGSGPNFTVGLDEPSGIIQINLQPSSDDKFCIEYNIDFQVEKKVGAAVQYRGVSITGRVIVGSGESVPIVKVGDHTLTLSLDASKK